MGKVKVNGQKVTKFEANVVAYQLASAVEASNINSSEELDTMLKDPASAYVASKALIKMTKDYTRLVTKDMNKLLKYCSDGETAKAVATRIGYVAEEYEVLVDAVKAEHAQEEIEKEAAKAEYEQKLEAKKAELEKRKADKKASAEAKAVEYEKKLAAKKVELQQKEAARKEKADAKKAEREKKKAERIEKVVETVVPEEVKNIINSAAGAAKEIIDVEGKVVEDQRTRVLDDEERTIPHFSHAVPNPALQ